jgi:hypothetical protein
MRPGDSGPGEDGMKELMGMMGREYRLTEGPFTVTVLVDDVKVAYGQARAYVSPVGGEGWAWVSVDRLQSV